MKFSEEVKNHWSMKSASTIHQYMTRFRKKLRAVSAYVHKGKFIVPSDEDSMTAVLTRTNSIMYCGERMTSGFKKYCGAPLLCDYCLNQKRAEIAECLLRHLQASKPLYCIEEEGSYSFLRGVYTDGDCIQILNNAPRSLCESLDLSGENEMRSFEIQDAFNDTLYLTKDTQDKLINWKSTQRIRYMRRKSYLGGVQVLYHIPLNLHTCAICASNLFFFDKFPKEDCIEEKENQYAGSIYVTHRYKRNIYQIVLDKDNQTGRDLSAPSVELFHFLCQKIRVRYTQMLQMGTEELAYHLSTLLGTKTFQRVGPIFSDIHKE